MHAGYFKHHPLEVVYSPTFSALAVEHYDILLMGIPVTFTGELTMQQERLAKAASMTDYLLLALPCHAQINAEELKNDGAAACLLKPSPPPACCPPSRSIAVLASMPFR